MPDNQEITAKIQAVNARINALEAQAKDASAERGQLPSLFQELKQALEAAATIAKKVQLLRALDELIYGRSTAEEDRGPSEWREYHLDTCRSLKAALEAKGAKEAEEVKEAKENRGEPKMEDLPDYLYLLINSQPLDSEAFEKEITPKARAIQERILTILQTQTVPNQQRETLHAALEESRPYI